MNYDYPVPCRKVEEASACADMYRPGCTADDFKQVNDSLAVIRSLAGQACPNADQTGGCNVENVYKCVMELKADGTNCG